MKNFQKNLTDKALPAAAGGVAAQVVTKIGSNILDKQANPDTYLNMLVPAAPAVLAILVMDGKNGAMDYAAAGMIGASAASMAAPIIEQTLGEEDVLADEDLEELFEEDEE
jgi:hypothetical protein